MNLGIPGIGDAVEIGRGGFSIVYRAFQLALDRSVAVKVLEVTEFDDSAQAAFKRECRAIGRLSGVTNVLPVHDAGLTPAGKPYLVMALAKESLEDSLARRGPMPVAEVVSVGVKVARALQFAHDAGILHRDVKPANILVSLDGEPQLADFGVAHLAGATRTSRTGLAFTPAHAPPEAFEGLAPTPASDVYSLASTLFNLIAGHPPFVEQPSDSPFVVVARVASAPVPDLRPRGVPEALCRVLEMALAKVPAQRPASAAAFAIALETANQPAATMPAEGELPPPVSSLGESHAITITDDHSHIDVKRLKRRLGAPTWIKVAVGLVLLALLSASGLALRGDGDTTSVTVIRPTDSTLAYGEEVEVDVRGLHEGEVVWFMTQGAKDQGINSRYQPTPEPRRSTGNRWLGEVYAGDRDDQKKAFHIHVVAANSDARQGFLDYSATAAATVTYPGFTQLPVGTRRIASFTITRR